MKKVLLMIAAALLLAGCTNTNDGQISPSPPPSPTAAVSQTIGAVDGMSSDKVAYIDYYDASSPDGVSAITYSKEDDIQGVMTWLSQLKLTAQAQPQTTAAPGTWGYYEIKGFDGSGITVSLVDNTVSFDGGTYTYEDPSGHNPADTVHTIWMAPQHRSYPVNTDTIIVELFNQSGSEMAVTFSPQLEQASTSGGWSGITCQGEFCASSDPVDTGVLPMTIDMNNWYPDSTPGIYRLMMDAYDEEGNPFKLSCIFELTEEKA